MYIPANHQSRHSRELAEQLRKSIDDFQARNPKASQEDVRAALQAVTPGAATTAVRRAAIATSIILGVGVAALIGTAWENRQQHRPVPWVPIAAGLAAGAAGVAVLWARARDG